MRLIDDAEIVFREIVEQAGRPLARLAAAEQPRVILDAGATADLHQHVDIVVRAGLEALGFEELVLSPQLRQALGQLGANPPDGTLDRGALRDEVSRRIDCRAIHRPDDVPGERIDLRDPLDFITPELDAHRLLVVGREDFDRIAAHAECAALEADVVALILHGDQISEQGVPAPLFSLLGRHQQLAVQLRVAQAVDGRDARDDDDVVALHQARRRAQPQALDVVVDGRVLGDVRVGRRHVGLGLVVVVIGNEEFDGVGREKRLELAVQLRRQRLVVRQHQRGLSEIGHDVRHRHRLAGAGDAKQGLILVAAAQSGPQLADRAWLITRRGRCVSELKRHRREN